MAPVLIPFQFDVPTVHLILRGLGKLPHEESRQAIDAIATHADATLNPPPTPKPKRARKPAPTVPPTEPPKTD